MRMKLIQFGLCLFIAFCLLDLVTSRGGGGGGGGRGGGGGGRGGRGSVRLVRGVPIFYAGTGGGRSSKTDNNVAGAPSGGSNNGVEKTGPKVDNKTGVFLIPDVDGSRVLPIFTPAEVHSYHRREGIGMSAWAIIALVLVVLGGGTLTWFCYTVGLPIWRERKRRHSLITNSQLQRPHEGIPLQETPSTATPSP